jgi:uncharacterized membrane protein YcjF (UPF0283 family)
MNNDNKEKKITLEEYQAQNTNPENIKAAKSFLFIFAMAIAVVMIVGLFFLVLKLFDIHEIAGYVGTVAAVLVFIFGYIVPVVKLKNTKSFMTDVNVTTTTKAQKYNRKLREDIADKMIDIAYKTDGISWYKEKNIGRLAVARHKNNHTELKEALKEIYTTDVKNSAEKIIRKSALSVGLVTALSQSEALDTILVLVHELNLIKDIVFLYGYRPTDTQMAKIYKNVLRNALIAYGVSSATSGLGKTISTSLITAIDKVSQSRNVITSTIGSVASGIAGTVVESGIQFAVNTSLTIIIGYQTKRYLVKEYRLQEMLDNVELLESEEEQAKIIESIKEEVKEKITSAKKTRKETIAKAAA